MRKPETIIIRGRAYGWRALLQARRAQLEARKAAQPEQPAPSLLAAECQVDDELSDYIVAQELEFLKRQSPRR
jgi:hypothetical protein